MLPSKEIPLPPEPTASRAEIVIESVAESAINSTFGPAHKINVSVDVSAIISD